MVRIVSFIWTLTAVFFLVSLAFIYANVGEVVNLDGTTKSISEWSLPRDEFFFIMLVAFIVINAIFRSLGYLLLKVPVTNLKRPTFMTTQSFKDRLVAWVVSFSAVINVAVILSLIIIGFANYAVNPRSTAIGWFGYLGFGLVAVWLVGLVVILSQRRSAA